MRGGQAVRFALPESSCLRASAPSVHPPTFSLCVQRHDLFFNSAATGGGGGGRRRGRVVKPNVVLASYETVLKDRSLFTVGLPGCGLWAADCLLYVCILPVANNIRNASIAHVALISISCCTACTAGTACTALQDITWATVIIDEAHRMKSTGSSTRAAIASMRIQWLLLLTGGWPAGADSG